LEQNIRFAIGLHILSTNAWNNGTASAGHPVCEEANPFLDASVQDGEVVH